MSSDQPFHPESLAVIGRPSRDASEYLAFVAYAEEQLRDINPSHVLSVLTPGFEMACVEAAIVLDIPVMVWERDNLEVKGWSDDLRVQYQETLNMAHAVLRVYYDPIDSLIRKSAALLVFQHEPTSDVNEAIQYAEKIGRPIVSTHPAWELRA